ncbi:hypothetical protein C0585_06765 [Candidatus Woesearchaeota archaeon]|nr:MAG: hypothetical protein C0585_06765 [Candidatus Woesearchaeota archaeon]
MSKNNEKNLSTIMYLAEQLGINLDDKRTAIATPEEMSTARMYDGSLEARVIPNSRPAVEIETPRGPGIWIELVDHTRDLAPEGAIYQIRTYVPKEDHKEGLTGDVYSVYVGKTGIMLDLPK